MKKLLSHSLPTLLILVVGTSASQATALTLSGAAPAWATATNWAPGGVLPGVNDNAILASTGVVDVRGSAAAFGAGTFGITEIQDLSFNSSAATSLVNASTSKAMVIVLNGGRGAGTPLISTTGNFAYAITGPGTGATTPQTLSLQLKASGDISVAANVLTISAVIAESGGARSINKTGVGRLILSGANTVTGGVTTTAGILEAANNSALGTGAAVVNSGGTLEVNVASATLTASSITVNTGGKIAVRNLTLNNNIILAGGTLATRTGDLGVFAGGVNVTADSIAHLISYSTPATDLSLTVSGPLSGAGGLTVNGNATNAAKALILTNTANTYSGIFTVTANQRLRSAPATTGNTLGTGTVNLTGGTLQLRDDGAGNNGILAYGNNVTVGAGGGTIDADRVGAVNTGNNFTLGTLSIGAQTLNTTGANSYGVNFAAATLTGNATVNPTTAPLNFNGIVGGAFSLTKTGAGNLKLAGANTYSGATNVDVGTLVLTGSIANSSRIDVKAGATLDVTSGGFTVASAQTLAGTGNVSGVTTVGNGGKVDSGDAAGTGTLTVSGLILGTAAGNTSTLNFTSTAPLGLLNVTNTNGLVPNGGANSVTVNVTGALPIGARPLVDYAGTIGGTGFGSFKLGTVPSRTIASLVNNTTNTTIDLNVTGVDSPLWSGAQSSEWSTNTIAGAKNWVLNSNNATTTDFLVADKVVFSDFGTTTTPDISVADVAPSDVNFTNINKNYTLTGSKAITGATGITKTGTGSVTISNTNSFTGPVAINGGTIAVASVANNGTNSPLGAGTALSLDGGTLDFTGPTASTNRVVTVNAGGGTINSANTLTVAGNTAGAGVLKKTGPGTLVLSGTANAHADTLISAGTLQVGDGAANAGTLGTGTVTNNTALVFDHTNAVTNTSTLTGAGTLEKKGSGALTLGGTTANTNLGVTTVTAGTLIAGKTVGLNAIGGDLIISTGGTFRYAGNNVSNQIPDTASVTLNGGTFGDPAILAPTNPGATDTIANLTINSGSFGSGRNIPVSPFTITGALHVNGGTALAQRGGAIDATTVVVNGGTINLDGGSTTVGQESRLDVGTGGLTLTSSSIGLNAAVSALTATSVGSIVKLNGNVTTTGASAFTRSNTATVGPKAIIDMIASAIIYDITGTLDIGTTASPVSVQGTGGLTKSGAGALNLSGINTYTGATVINAGTLTLGANASILTSPSVLIKAGSTLDVTAVTGGYQLGAAQTLGGKGTLLGSLTTTTGAHISPGESPGTLTVNGNVDLIGSITGANAGVMIYELASPGASDLLQLTAGNALTIGSGLLDFGDFNFSTLAGFGQGNYTLIATNQPISGTLGNPFGTVGGFPAVLGTDGQNITLSVIPEPSSTAALTLAAACLGFRRRRA